MTTNNQVEYEAVLKGLQLLHEVKAKSIEVFGDSQLIINQLIDLYDCKDDILRGYYDECQRLLKEFPIFFFSIFQEHRIKRLIGSLRVRQVIECFKKS